MLTGAFKTGTLGFRYSSFPLRRVVHLTVKRIGSTTRRTNNKEEVCATLSVKPAKGLLGPVNSLSFRATCRAFGRIVVLKRGTNTSLVRVRAVDSACRLGTTILTTGRGASLPIFTAAVFSRHKGLLAKTSIPSIITVLRKLEVSTLKVGYKVKPRRVLPVLRRVVGCSSIPIVIGPGTNLPGRGSKRACCSISPRRFTSIVYRIISLKTIIVKKYYKAAPTRVTRVIGRYGSVPIGPVRGGDCAMMSSCNRDIFLKAKSGVVNRHVGPAKGGHFGRTLGRRSLSCVLGRKVTRRSGNTRVLSIGMKLPSVSRPALVGRIIRRLRDIAGLPLRVSAISAITVRGTLHVCGNGTVIGSIDKGRRSVSTIFPLVQGCNNIIVNLTLSRSKVPTATRKHMRVTGGVVTRTTGCNVRGGSVMVSTLTVAVDSRPRKTGIALRALHELHSRINIYAILNMSGVSFNLPDEPVMGSVFCAVTVRGNLDIKVVGPGSRSVVGT